MKHLSMKVKGRVQGVFFRKNTKEAADRLKVFGWVMNEEDGSVIIEAESEENQLREFLQWAKTGPRSADVDKVEEKWSKKIVGYHGFEIR